MLAILLQETATFLNRESSCLQAPARLAALVPLLVSHNRSDVLRVHLKYKSIAVSYLERCPLALFPNFTALLLRPIFTI